MENKKLHVIGAGLSGSEAAWQAAQRGIEVILHEMRPQKYSPAHKSENFAELVCSNSLRSDDFEHNAVGLMHEEMRRAGSLIMQCADATKVPAGGALAVDRTGFSQMVTEKIKQHPNIKIIYEELTTLPPPDFGEVIIATGPLTSETLAQDILQQVDNQSLSFFDAIAPVVYKDSINFDKAWYQSRYDKGNKFDYINCPLNKEEYYAFLQALKDGEKTQFHDWEDVHYFEGCLPIEVMAERGDETLTYGPMKPIGLSNPHSQEKPYAVVQLRQDNKEDTLRNMVGFQTKLKYGEQQRIFRMIPGLEHAEFARFGGIHKNTFIKSPILLDEFLRLKSRPNIRFAGQITGCEGYIESACIGYLAGYFAAMQIQDRTPILPPRETAFGSMLNHLTDATNIEDFQPMNINFGIFPTISGERTANGKFRKIKGMDRKKAYSIRALEAINNWINEINKP